MNGTTTTLTPEQLFNLRFGCVHAISGVPSTYGYIPSLGAGIVFIVLFALSLFVHLIHAVRFREMTSALLVIGALAEALGWVARTWSSQCPYTRNAFLMQTTTLIIAPTFFTAAAYVVLGRLIILAGPKSSAFKARTYIIVFVTCDLISLIVQAVGGSIASGESNKINGNTKPGTRIMVAGILFQMASMTIFVGVLVDFLVRCTRLLDNILKAAQFRVIAAMMLSVVAIYTRSIYRTIELIQGWEGYLMTHERFFIGFDAALMVFAVAIYHVPGVNFRTLRLPVENSESGQTDNEQEHKHRLSDGG